MVLFGSKDGYAYCLRASDGQLVWRFLAAPTDRRIAHFDYWSERVRRSILVDSKADLLVYGNGERAIVEIAHRLGRGDDIDEIRDVRGTAFFNNICPR